MVGDRRLWQTIRKEASTYVPGGTIPGITGAMPGMTMGGAMPGMTVGYMSPI